MLRKLLLSTTCLSACMSLSAREITQGDYVFDIVGYWTDEPVAEIVARAPGFNPTGEVVIPSSVTYEGKTYPVTELGKYFNYYNEPAVYPPVFADLPGLTSVVLPASLTYVSPNEFENCPALKEFKVEKGNEKYFTRDGILYESHMTTELIRIPPAKQLVTYTLPSDIKAVNEYAFAGNTTLKTIVISGDQKLGGCWQLGNKSITNIDVSKSTQYDTKRSKNGFVFYTGGFKALTDVAPGIKMDSYTVPDDITHIMDGAFANSSIKNVVLTGSSLQDGISSAAFQCSDIESVTISGSQSDWIGFAAFFGCKKLTTVTLQTHKSDATQIDPYAFSNCPNLSKITIATKAPVTIGQHAFSNSPKLSAFSIPDGCTIATIKNHAFADCKSLKTFSLQYVKEIDTYDGHQFAGSGLTKVNWPSSLTEIPKGCFKDCQSLKEISLKETTRKIDMGAFRNTAIETLNTAGATVINFDSFLDCKNLRKIVIPRNQEPVGFIGAFSGDVDGTQLIINTPLRHYTSIDDPMNYSNVDVYTSVNGEDNKWDIFLPYPFDNEKTDWKSANVPAHAASAYQIYSVKPVNEMFSYYNDPTQKTATVTSLNPIVSIKGVTIEGVAATKNGNVWSAPKAVISSKDKMNVTIDYTVNGAKMQTSYTKLYSAASTDDIMMTDGASVSITLNGRTAEFGADTPWSIYNLQGSAVATGRGVSADCSQLPSGLYIIRAAGSALKVRLD